MYIYHGLCATIREWKAESDGILGSVLGFTVALAWRDPDCIQVQRWDCGIPRDGNVEPILAAGKMRRYQWMIIFVHLCKRHTDMMITLKQTSGFYLEATLRNATFNFTLTDERYRLDNFNSSPVRKCHDDNSQICHVFLLNIMVKKD